MSSTTLTSRTARPCRGGFTLIELLVVIAIIAILAAILFPVFQKVRENARKTACLSNVKQIGLGILQYQQDFDEVSPGGGDGYGQGGGWAGEMYSYVKSTALYRCPDDAGIMDPGTATSSYAINNNTTNINPACVAAGYDYNVCGKIPGVGTPLAKFNSPAKTVLLFEVQNSRYYDVSLPNGVNGSDSLYGGGSAAGRGIFQPVGFNGKQYSDPTDKPGDGTLKYATGVFNGLTANVNSFLTPDGRHNGGANYLMADDHAKWFRSSSISPGYNANKETDAQVNDNPANGQGTAAGTNGPFQGSTVQPAATFSLQ